MEWTREKGAQYNIGITPSVTITVNGSTIVQLLLLYNTEYNVSLEAVNPCQSIASSNVQLFYGELNINCAYALLQLSVEIYSR